MLAAASLSCAEVETSIPADALLWAEDRDATTDNGRDQSRYGHLCEHGWLWSDAVHVYSSGAPGSAGFAAERTWETPRPSEAGAAMARRAPRVCYAGPAPPGR